MEGRAADIGGEGLSGEEWQCIEPEVRVREWSCSCHWRCLALAMVGLSMPTWRVYAAYVI